MAIDESRWIAAKYGKNLGAEKVEQGNIPLQPSSPASAGQTDVTLRFDPAQANVADKALREAEAKEKAQVQHITQPSPEPQEDDVVTVGGVSMYPQTLRGFEANFTRGGHDPYVFEVEGMRLTAGEGLIKLYEALKAQQRKGGRR